MKLKRVTLYSLSPLSRLVLHEQIVTCAKNETVFEVICKMTQNNIGSIVIVDNNKPVGIFTERDLMKKVVAQGIDVKSALIEIVMTPNPVCIKEHTPLIKIMGAMRLGKFRHLVIVDGNGLLKGVVSIKDVLNFITDHVLN